MEFGGGSISGGGGTMMDYHWIVGQGRILDRTEFVLQLVRESDNSILSVLDSVGVDTNPESKLAKRYGTNPDMMAHSVVLPNEFAGVEVYLRVSPRRFGITQYGVHFRIFSNWINLSILSEYQITDSIAFTRQCNQSDFEILEEMYFSELISYCDSIKAETGWLPNAIYHLNLSHPFDSLFFARYFEPFITQTGDTLLSEITDPLFYSKKSDNLEKQLTNDTFYCRPGIISVEPIPANELLNILISSHSEINMCFIELYDFSEIKLNTLWKGKISIPYNKITINVKDYNNGSYIILLKDSRGIVFDTSRIVIYR